MHRINSQAVWYDNIMFHLSRYTLYITQSHVLARNQMYVSRENVTTFVMRWYIYGMLLHLQTSMAPVNVATHHKCINGESCDISRFATDIYWHQLDINQRCVSKSTSTYTIQIGVEVESLKSKGHPHCQVTTFMVSYSERWTLKWPQML